MAGILRGSVIQRRFGASKAGELPNRIADARHDCSWGVLWERIGEHLPSCEALGLVRDVAWCFVRTCYTDRSEGFGRSQKRRLFPLVCVAAIERPC